MEEFEYLVSVVIPVYNAEKYLPRAVRSLRKQTLAQDKVEILLIDDGSTDHSPALCDRYAQKYSNIRVFHQKNAGVSAARNKGIIAAKGKYLFFLDADDTISKETLQNVTFFFDEHYDEIDVVGFTTVFRYSNGKIKEHPRDLLIPQSGIINCDNPAYINLTRLSVLVKNQGTRNELFSEELWFHEDEDYLIRTIARLSAFGYVKEACYYYQQGTGGATDTYSAPGELVASSVKMYQNWIQEFRNSKTMYMYVQNCILGDFAWKMREGKLLSKDPKSKQYEEDLSQIKTVISQLEEEMILNNPMLDFRDRFFLMANKLSTAKEDQHTKAIYVFLTSMQIQNGKTFIIGMIENPLQEKGQMNLYISSEGGNNRLSVKIRRFSWQDDAEKKAECYYGFFETIECDRRDIISFSAEQNGISIPVKCVFGPDALEHSAKSKSDLKHLLFKWGIGAAKQMYGYVQLCNNCDETVRVCKIETNKFRRYRVETNKSYVDLKPVRSEALLFRSWKHKLLFLLADDIIIGSPWEKYIPIYEKTYLSLRGLIKHRVILATCDGE